MEVLKTPRSGYFDVQTYNQRKVMQKVRFDQADGYTHCDIDAIFGRLWKHIRNKPVLSPFDSSQNFTHYFRIIRSQHKR